MDVRVHGQVYLDKPIVESPCSGTGIFYVIYKFPTGILGGVAKRSKAPVRNTGIVGSNPAAALLATEKQDSHQT